MLGKHWHTQDMIIAGRTTNMVVYINIQKKHTTGVHEYEAILNDELSHSSCSDHIPLVY